MPTIHSIGYISKKTQWIDHPFRTVNFSFILSGQGEYTCPDGTWEVSAPCVITQWPDAKCYYGPDSSWEEFYVCFPGKYYRDFLKNGLMSVHRRLWPVADLRRLRNSIADFLNLIKDDDSAGLADRADLAIQNVILESLLGTEVDIDDNERAINDVRLKVEMNYLADHDFDELALDAGMSPSTFRRYWQDVVKMPPGRYVMHLRINRARRYLIETRLSVAEIAEKVGFDDQLYFTRKFRQFTGMSPTEYRRLNQMPPLL